MHEAAHAIEIFLHAFGIDQQLVHHRRQPAQREIERDCRIGADEAFNRRMRNVAFVPQRDVFQRRGHRAAHHAGKAGQVFGQDRIALVRHRRGALLAGRKVFFGFQHFGALQVTHLDCQPLDRAGDDAQCGKEHRVAVARDHLGRYRFDRQTQLFGNVFFDCRIDIGERAHRSRDRASGDFGARRDQPRTVAGEFGIGLGQFLAERGRFGMDTVAATDGGGVLVFQRAALECGQQCIDVGNQQVRRARQLHAERGVEHVRTGHALVHEARFGANLRRHPVEERDHVMLGHRFDRIDRRHIDHRIGRPPVPQRLGRAVRHNAKLGQLVGGMGLDFEPDAVTRLRVPDRGHLRACVTGNHGEPSRTELAPAPLGCAASKGKTKSRSAPSPSTKHAPRDR